MTDHRSAPAKHLRQMPLDELLRLGHQAVDAAIAEDLSLGDPTSEALFDHTRRIRAVILAKERGVVAGLPIAERVFSTIDKSIHFSPLVDDGERIEPGDVLAEIVGSARTVLSGERTALNFLQRMSGIATRTARLGRRIATTPAILLDTRKTVPGLRALDKYAVRLGGGVNHRLTLADLAMIKDTHLVAFGSIEDAVAAIRQHAPGLPVEIEVRSLTELDRVLDLEPLPECILLDNFEVESLREAVRRISSRTFVEASGGVTLETIGAIAETGVDAISVGELTHSPHALDISMEVPTPNPVEPLAERVGRLRQQLSDRIVHLAHHYVRESVVEQADIVGDSLALARAARETPSEIIVFSGVRFMGEMAAILCRETQRVVMPCPNAGCFLADCADLPSIEAAWRTLEGLVEAAQVVPVTYVNSSAELKAFCGRHGGIVCTSTNATQVLDWALARGDCVFFFPDQHLGRNTALAAGIAPEEIITWPPSGPPVPEEIRSARVIVWPGACNVHRRFRAEHIERIRTLHPEAVIAVHPECPEDVVRAADVVGSTSKLVDTVENAPDGATLAIGTEAHLVRRLQRQQPAKQILNLADVAPFCRTMTKTTLDALRRVLEAIDDGRTTDWEIHVPQEIESKARTALTRMLEL